MPRNVAILLFDEVEVLDFAGPFEVFGVTGRNAPEKPFNVYTVAEKPGTISARNKLIVTPTYTFANCPKPDILVVPGGYGTRPLLNSPTVLDWIKSISQATELTLSVCTGALLLGKIGLLDGHDSTTHYGSYDLLKEVAPATTVRPGARYVDNGHVVTSAGISAGIDMALHIVARLLGKDTALETAQHMEYDWRVAETS